MPTWTIEQIEEALRERDGDLGVHDGIQHRVTRTSDEGQSVNSNGIGPTSISNGLTIFRRMPQDSFIFPR